MNRVKSKQLRSAINFIGNKYRINREDMPKYVQKLLPEMLKKKYVIFQYEPFFLVNTEVGSIRICKRLGWKLTDKGKIQYNPRNLVPFTVEELEDL